MKTKFPLSLFIPSFILSIFLVIFGMSGEAFAVYWADSIFDFYDSGNGFGGGIDKHGDGYYESWRGDQIYYSGVNPAVALGQPDEFFVSILPGEYITAGFSIPFINGPGNDFFVAETGHAEEEASVSVSFDGINFTSLGAATVPATQSNTISFGDYYWFDLDGLTQSVHYVKITGVRACGASDGFDLTGVGAKYPIPEPASLSLLGLGLLGLWGLRKKRGTSV